MNRTIAELSMLSILENDLTMLNDLSKGIKSWQC